MRKFKNLLLISMGLFVGTQVFAQAARTTNFIVEPNLNIAENLHRSSAHSEFVQALKNSGIMDLLDGKGPYSVFALDNESWKKLPDMNATEMNTFLKNHVIPIKLDKMELATRLKANMNIFTVASLNDVNVSIRMDGEKLIIDIPGAESEFVIFSALEASNGIVNGTGFSL